MAESQRFKICLLGDHGVGKTTLFNYILKNNVEGLPLAEMEIEVRLGQETYKVVIWDTAGQEKFRSLVEPFLRGAHAVIIMFDVTDKKTFENLNHWINLVKTVNQDGHCEIVIAGNKVDLYNRREVMWITGNSFAEANSIKFWETSVMWGKNIDIVLETIVHDILRSQTLSHIAKPSNPVKIQSEPNGILSSCASKVSWC